jgi:glutamine amidotransferase PdxT
MRVCLGPGALRSGRSATPTAVSACPSTRVSRCAVSTGGSVDAAFIRAPRVVAVLDPTVEVLAEVDGDPVVVQQGSMLAMTFHPEVTGDLRLHAHFAVMVRERAAR